MTIGKYSELNLTVTKMKGLFWFVDFRSWYVIYKKVDVWDHVSSINYIILTTDKLYGFIIDETVYLLMTPNMKWFNYYDLNLFYFGSVHVTEYGH